MLETVEARNPLEQVLISLPLKVHALDIQQWNEKRRRDQVLQALTEIEVETAGKIAMARDDATGKQAYPNEAAREAQLQLSLKAHQTHQRLKTALWDADDNIAKLSRDHRLAEDELKAARILGLLRASSVTGAV